MSQAKAAISKVLQPDGQEADGRRARSQASRSKIIKAMMDLIEAGDINPSAADVAEKAGVGLRSVFRHFDDKDKIFQEIDAILVEANEPIMYAPYRHDGWQDRLFEIIERRCEVSEAIAPFRIGTSLARKKSEFLRESYRQLHQKEKAQLNAVLPSQLQTDTIAGRAIMVCTSFDTWRLLRQDEGLSAIETVAAMKQLARSILDQVEVQVTSD